MKTEVILSALEAKHPGEKEYLQAVKEVLLSIEDVYNQHPEFEKAKIPGFTNPPLVPFFHSCDSVFP